MSHRYLLLDTSFLCWREFYGPARRDAHAVAPGVLAELPEWVDKFRATPVWFCDRGPYKRSDLFAEYKKPEKKPDPVGDKEKAACRAAIDAFREEVLPSGYRVEQCPGYESDDLIASFVRNLSKGSTAVIVSRDADLYQLLQPGVCFYNPMSHGGLTDVGFREKYGLPPADWAEVKALAGCASDNVPGCEGVAEVTAVKYVRGDFHKIEGFRRKKIEAFYGGGGVGRNLKLTRLPFDGTPDVLPERP